MWQFIVLGFILSVNGYSCPEYCNQRGICHDEGRCECDDGWEGPSCAKAICPMGLAWADSVSATDTGHALATCSNRGTCDNKSGDCDCDVGFEGAACERKTCDCNKRGTCMSMKNYALAKVAGTVYEYSSNWDAEKMHGCVCDAGYSGSNCELRECPKGDDPFTGMTSDPNGVQYNEKQLVTCTATSGSFYLQFNGFTTEAISTLDTVDQVKQKLENLKSITSVEVAFGGITTTACTSSGNAIRVEFTQDFGNLPSMVGNGANLLHTSGTPSVVISTLVEGTKENAVCSNRGICNTETGTCTCAEGFASSDGNGNIGLRGDCGYATTEIVHCPGDIECSNHGVCSEKPSYTCECSYGWTGADCSQRVCNSGKAWFDMPSATDTAHDTAECSNAGTCDRRRGDCLCSAGFSGGSCNRLDCPKDCNNQGTCNTMEEIARDTTLNGDETSWTYGETPNKIQTWDYDMVQGCQCNAGWDGHSCSTRTCTRGDDVLTIKDRETGFGIQHDEKQVLTCTATSGSFKLTFRAQTTASISFDATSTVLKSSLEALTSIDRVTITYSSGASFCTAGGTNLVSIQFNTDHGDLPKLTATLDGITSILIQADGEGTSIKGTKENAICSNRGICDTSTGICRCFFGFTSSDGNGQPGDRGDCGYVEPMYSLSAAHARNEL